MCSTVSTEDVSTQCVPEVQRESTQTALEVKEQSAQTALEVKEESAQTALEVKEESAQTESRFSAGESCSSYSYSFITCFLLHGIWMVIVYSHCFQVLCVEWMCWLRQS